MIIDAHVHLISGTPGNEYLPPRYRLDRSFIWAYSGGSKWTNGYERDPMDLYPRMEERVADPDGTATVSALDKAGVDAAVLIHADFGPSRGELPPKTMEEMQHDYVELQEKHSGRLYGFLGPDVRRPGSLEVVERGLSEWGLKGLKVMPQLGYYASDRMLYPFYQKCLEYDVPIAICTNYESSYSRAVFNDPIHISSLVADFPDLKVIIFHSGYPFDHWFEESVLIGHTAFNVYLEFAGWFVGGGKRPNLTEEEWVRKLAYARDMVGAHRMIMGTDGQFSHGSWGTRSAERYAQVIEGWRSLRTTAKKYGIEFSQEEVDLITGMNMARLLKLVDMPQYNLRKYGWSILTPPPRLSP